MAEQLRDAGLDPLTWAFARLLGRQLRRDVRELPGLPASHAWRPAAASAARVLTKARCLGVVVSVLPRAERVEFLLDDGTALVKAVLWGPPERAAARLGDLVEVEGKLNANASVEGADPNHPRELRVTRMSVVDDPNEELLHWVQVVQLTRAYYPTSEAASGGSVPEASAARSSRRRLSVGERWERVGREAFFHLRVSPEAGSRTGDDQRDRVLLDVVGRLVRRQVDALDAAGAERRAVRVTFAAVLRDLSPPDDQAPIAESNQRAAVRDLRFAFHTMRSIGLLFLEDEDADVHELLSYELALRPAIVEIVSDRPAGTSLADIVDVLTSRPRFRRVPLLWIEQGFRQAVADGVIQQRPESQTVYAATAQLPGRQDQRDHLREQHTTHGSV